MVNDSGKLRYASHAIKSTNPRQHAEAEFEIEPNFKCRVEQVRNSITCKDDFPQLVVKENGRDRAINLHAWAHISVLNDELEGMICSVRELEARISEGQLVGLQVKKAFAEMFPPATLVHPAIQTMPAIYPALSNWLIKMAQHSLHTHRTESSWLLPRRCTPIVKTQMRI